jgi:hypothetical protein
MTVPVPIRLNTIIRAHASFSLVAKIGDAKTLWGANALDLLVSDSSCEKLLLLLLLLLPLCQLPTHTNTQNNYTVSC